MKWLLAGLLAAVSCSASAGAVFDAAPARAALKRLLPRHEAQIALAALAPGAGDRYSIRGTPGHIEIAGTSPAALLTGVEAYLEQVPHVSIGWPGDSLDRLPATLPAPSRPIESHALVPDRFALNDVDDGYSDAYLDWPGWERKIDLLALRGINEVFVPVGAEEVYRRAFHEFGYSDDELRAWIPAPAHQPWWLLQNMSGFGGPMSAQLFAQRVELGRRIVERLRELGMQPVLPGYFGTVPPGFAAKQPGAALVPQGEWVGFQRPDWLDPRDAHFAKVAAAFYRHQRELFGDGVLYKMDLLHEGGRAGDVPVGDAAKQVFAALDASHPAARWVLLGWQHNPPHAVMEAVPHERLLIVDGLSDRYNGMDRKRDWAGAPFAFGTIPNFGGHATLGANAGVWIQRFAAWRREDVGSLRGIAYMPEGSGTDPATYALFTALAWTPVPDDAPRWFERYAVHRYGGDDAHARAAWRILAQTAYAMPSGEWSEPHDGLFGARPSLDARSAATWSPTAARYDLARFNGAVCELLKVAPALRSTSAYRHDLVDVTRQALSNRSRLLLPRIKAAYEAKDAKQFQALTTEWMDDMAMLDRLLASDPDFLLGRWLMHAKAAARDDAEAAQLEYDQRSILASWGDRSGADRGGLHDYANRELAGLVGGLYAQRWRHFFDTLQSGLNGGEVQAIDWFALEQAWAHAREPQTTEPVGDAWQLAGEAAGQLGLCRGGAGAPPRGR
ncbi:alpha-N-acetylglucosaminidase C-terminal domain-containing protein [Dyella sp. LX-66]|nr:alpha-N-acetylglucosaminidase [Dyella sp. LX-1]MBT2118096.1 alpha-N-acetylglucosaminidase C-terminal domain-containing protein [Dyella sp. LX-1]MBT2141003.1 alpha-N-acetylglucosaminidase C-terminal domain-containing protein [Dyella sp. LX-66]